jgi:hypothetical protein
MTMRYRPSLVLVVVGVLSLSGRDVRAEDKPERLHAPREVLTSIPIDVAPVVPGVHFRESYYDRWQMLDVDSRGRFRVRVIRTPDGGTYYQHSGEPYPWPTTDALRIVPRIVY